MSSSIEPGGMTGPFRFLWRISPVLIAALFLGVAIAMVVMGLDFNEEARRLPLAIGFPLAGLAAANFVIEVRAALRASGDDVFESPALDTSPLGDGEGRTATTAAQVDDKEVADHEAGGGVPDQSPGIPVSQSLLVLVVLVVVYIALGHMLATPIFVIFVVRFVGKQSWVTALLVSALTVGITYVLVYYLGIQTFPGRLPRRFPWLNLF